MITRLFVANRGAVAHRIVRSCRTLGIDTRVPFTPSEANAPFVEAAGAGVPLPEPPPNPYLDGATLIQLAKQQRCDAIHPGYGFLAEQADFAAAVRAAGLIFVGPSTELIAELGDKANARRRLASLGLPVFKGSPPLRDETELAQWADRLGLPLLIKPVAGGGGIGMRLVRDRAQLASEFATARRLAAATFTDDRVFLERFVERGRHIELQLLGVGDGKVVAFGERECSVQRRQQKLIEESPAPGISGPELDVLTARAVTAFEQLGYESLGTLELLRDEAGAYGVLEVNTRLQVEHGVTEAVYGTDLVALQLRAAVGEQLDAPGPPRGHSIEARIYAEDTIRQLPSTGTLSELRWPRMTGIRVEPAYGQGQSLGPHFDPLLGKLISWAPGRDLAIGQLRTALKALRVEGVQTNVRQLEAILGSDRFASGRWTTDQLDGRPRIAQSLS
ncbi:MAG: biotin carboxylase N-terminal domain-containing protein [Pseudomonadota bacterium]